MTPETERGVLDTAEVTAAYFKALIGHGIERAEAIQLTTSYVTMLTALAQQQVAAATRAFSAGPVS